MMKNLGKLKKEFMSMDEESSIAPYLCRNKSPGPKLEAHRLKAVSSSPEEDRGSQNDL